MLTNTALSSLRAHFRDNIAYARYKIGEETYRAEIETTSILSDGRIVITFIIDHSVAGDVTVTEVQLYDKNDELWASKPESITRKDAEEGILYRFRFMIIEEEA